MCKTDVECCDGENIDAIINIYAASQERVDLLNPDAFQQSEVKIFELINGTVTPVRYFFHRARPSDEYKKYSLDLNANIYSTDEFPITYIQWNEDDTDTLKAEFDRGNNYEIVTKVWFNDELVWDLLLDGDLR